MGKIAPVSAKYIVHVEIRADGIVEKPDVIGAVFGQTEGLLGTDLELRELQKSGRIGRIEVNLDTRGGKTNGTILIPSSLDMAETAVVASAIETIQRIGPCNAKLIIKNIEDVRVTKREYVVDRAKELLRKMIEKGPESAELMDEIKKTVRSLEITEFGKDRLPAGPGITESDEIIVVEGRADVVALLKDGFRNVIGLNGTAMPQTIANLSKTKTTTVFVDGDRGGLLIVKELIQVADIDFIAMAPPGKEVEELTKKEIHKALRAKVPLDQFKEEMAAEMEKIEKKSRIEQTYEKKEETREERREERREDRRPQPRYERREERYERREDRRPQPRAPRISPELAKQFKKMLEELVGTRGSYLLDKNMNILGKVPTKELSNTLQNLPDADVIIMDGQATPGLIKMAENFNISYLIAMSSTGTSYRVKILTAEDLGL